jgi:HEAT repeat protein
MLCWAFSVVQGLVIFSLQFTALSRVVKNGQIDFIPYLFGVQAIVSLLFTFVLKRKTARGLKIQGVVLFVLAGILVTGFSDTYINKTDSLFKSVCLYLFGQILINALRMNSQIFLSANIAPIRTAETTGWISIGEEFGILLAAILLMFQQSFNFDGSQFVWLVPSLLAGTILVQMKNFRDHSNHGPNLIQPKIKRSLFKVSSFFVPLTFSLAILICLKWIQSYGFVLGMLKLSHQNSSLPFLFSKLSVFQSLITIGIIFFDFRWANKENRSRFRGFMILGMYHAVFFLLATLVCGKADFAFALVLVVGEVLRKIIEHSFYSASLHLFSSSLSASDRLTIRQNIERWSVVMGTALAGLVCGTFLQNESYAVCLWVTGFLMSLVVLRLLSWSVKQIGAYHLSLVASTELDGQIRAIQALGNKDYREQAAVLAQILKNRPRPVVTKNLLIAIGRSQNPKFVGLISSYLKENREDIQSAAAVALSELPGYEGNFPLLNSLKDLVRTGKDQKVALAKVVMSKLKDLAIPYLLEILSSENDPRTLANVIEVLGEYGNQKKDFELINYLSRFLGPENSRRIRANTLIALWHAKPWREKAELVLFELLLSENELDRSAAYFAIGSLHLTSYEHLLISEMVKSDKPSESILIALLRLDNDYAQNFIAETLISDDSNFEPHLVISLSGVEAKIRRRVWTVVLHKYPHRIRILSSRLKNSLRDFEFDREFLKEAEASASWAGISQDIPLIEAVSKAA